MSSGVDVSTGPRPERLQPTPEGVWLTLIEPVDNQGGCFVAVAIDELGQTDIKIKAEIDAYSAEQVKKECMDRFFEHCPKGAGLVLDLANVSFLDCSGLSLLITTRQRSLDRGVTFKLDNVPKHVAKLLNITGLNKHFGSNEPLPED